MSNLNYRGEGQKTMRLIWRLRFWFSDRWFDLRSFFQRLTKGYAEKECWDLFYYNARWLVPRLKRLREIKHGPPAQLTEQKWDNILAKMILAFELIARNEEEEPDGTIKPAVAEGLRLFAKWYLALWD